MTVREARKAAGMTQRQLSEWLNIPRRTIEDWETEKRSCPPWCEAILVKIIQNKDEYDKFKTIR